MHATRNIEYQGLPRRTCSEAMARRGSNPFMQLARNLKSAKRSQAEIAEILGSTVHNL